MSSSSALQGSQPVRIPRHRTARGCAQASQRLSRLRGGESGIRTHETSDVGQESRQLSQREASAIVGDSRSKSATARRVGASSGATTGETHDDGRGGVSTASDVDLARILALARAVDAFAEAGMIDHLRPAARELLEYVEGVRAEAGADVHSIATARRKRRPR